nr:ankyrin repeat domain-containing protein SOWAHB-like isoform X1 [Hydra vulgaris]
MFCSSYSGYTPLHLAAVSGHNQVIVQLIELYGANIHQRDHSGKKPKDIVKDTVAADVQRKLGRSLILAADVVISHDSLTTLNKLHKRSNSETELVSDLPESTRSHLKTVSVVTPRSMSFLKLAKKHEVRLKSENSAESPKLPTRRVSKPILRERPKTQVISVPPNAFHQMVQPKASFEI